MAEARTDAARRVASTLDDTTGALTDASKELIATELAALGVADNFEAAGFAGERLWQVLDQTTEVSEETQQAYKALLRELFTGTELTNEQEQALDDLLGGYTEGFRIWKQTQGLIGDLGEEGGDTTDEVADLEQAWRDLVDQLLGGQSAQTDAMLLVQDIAASIDDLDDKSTADVRQQVEDFVAELAGIKGAAADAGVDITNLSDTAELGLIAIMDQAGLSAEFVDEVIAALRRLDGMEAQAHLSVNMTGQPLSRITGVIPQGASTPSVADLNSLSPAERQAFDAFTSGGSREIHVHTHIDGVEVAETVVNESRYAGGLVSE